MPDQPNKPATDGVLVESLIAQPTMLPGEDPAAYEGLRGALLLDLAPRSPYERLLAENLIILEWEIGRHRSLRDQLIRAKARELTTGLFQHGTVRLPYNPSREQAALAAAWVAPTSGADVEAAEKAIRALSVSPAEILARAHSHVAEQVDLHERRVADLERRRQRLKEEYDRLRATRRPPIEDAEIVT